jgi:hypothetical protein
MDACEDGGVQFRVLRWDLGMTGKSPSTVALQIMSKDRHSLDETLDTILKIVDECGVEFYQGDLDDEGGYEGMMSKDILTIDKN